VAGERLGARLRSRRKAVAMGNRYAQRETLPVRPTHGNVIFSIRHQRCYIADGFANIKTDLRAFCLARVACWWHTATPSRASLRCVYQPDDAGEL